MSHTSAAILSTFTPDDAEDVAAWAAVRTAADAVDAPWEPALTPRRAAGGCATDGTARSTLLICCERRGSPWRPAPCRPASTTICTGLRPGPGRALAPTPRPRLPVAGGSARRVRRRGRTTAVVEGWIAPSAEAFAARHGFEPALRDARRRQHLDRLHLDRIRALRDEAAGARCGLPARALAGADAIGAAREARALTAVMNDAPLDGLDYEDEVVTAEAECAGTRNAVAGHGDRLHRLVARHRVSGELAGQTIVAVDAETSRACRAARHGGGRSPPRAPSRPAAQGGDGAASRRRRTPLRAIDTWNAASNVPMLRSTTARLPGSSASSGPTSATSDRRRGEAGASKGRSDDVAGAAPQLGGRLP